MVAAPGAPTHGPEFATRGAGRLQEPSCVYDLGPMTEPAREDDPFDWADEPEADDPAPTSDLRRVGQVLSIAVVLLVVLLAVLAKVAGGVFADMWHSVFTF